MTAGLSQYKKLNNVANMACLAHIRRKFYEVHEILKGKTKEKAHVLLTLYNDLYTIERKIVDLPRNERLNIRQKESKEILNLIHKELDECQLNFPQSSNIGKAIFYALKNHKDACVYLLDPDLPMDNNFAERRVKSIIMNRKNCLFANTISGMQASTVYYSLLESAKSNNINLYDYLINLFNNYKDLEVNTNSY